MLSTSSPLRDRPATFFLTTMRTLLFVFVLFPLAILGTAQTQPQLNLMPMPSTVQLGTGQLPINRSFSVVVTGARDTTLDRGVERFLAQLAQQTGMLLRSKLADSNATLSIHADHGR